VERFYLKQAAVLAEVQEVALAVQEALCWIDLPLPLATLESVAQVNLGLPEELERVAMRLFWSVVLYPVSAQQAVERFYLKQAALLAGWCLLLVVPGLQPPPGPAPPLL